MNKKSGFTLIEAMLTVAILAIVSAAIVSLLAPNITFFQRIKARQSANLESRRALDTIRRLLAQGKANTIQIWTDPGAPPNSHIQFFGVDNSSYTITWSNTPPNSVHVMQVLNGSASTNDIVIATNVTSLIFSLDFRDPAVISFSLELEVPLDASGSTTNVYSLFQPSQEVRMVVSQ